MRGVARVPAGGGSHARPLPGLAELRLDEAADAGLIRRIRAAWKAAR